MIMKKISILFLLLIALSTETMAQQKIMSILEAEKSGISIQKLDSLYKSAVHSNQDLAVFKTPEDQARLQGAYIQFFQKLGVFLSKNNFKWEQKTRCFNRIYMNNDGSIEYFIYNFNKDQISASKEKEFTNLLSLFIQENKFPISANEKFAQCSPISYISN
jgi:hypothetical protein